MDGSQVVAETFFRLCKSVDTPVSLGCWLRYEHAQDELANISIDPGSYIEAAAFYRDYVCVSFLRKYKGLVTGIDTTSAAILNFVEGEEKNRLTNERFRTFEAHVQLGRLGEAILPLIRRYISEVWGQPKFDDLFRQCGWGPGATATLKGAYATTEHKMSTLPLSVTPTALPYLRAVMKNDFAWIEHIVNERYPIEPEYSPIPNKYHVDVEGPACLTQSCYSLRDHSRLLTVTKNAKIDRVINAEPTGNSFLQQGPGKYIRNRLRKYGIDLSNQGANQRLASLAQQLGLATIDLSNASASICTLFCREVLPHDMFAVLDALRSPAYGSKDPETKELTVVRTHGFCSMGNGFTFELETLIFWATAKAVMNVSGCRGPLGVYGDDIIVPQSCSDLLIQVLEVCGFKVNTSKSFTRGRFFESCGKHYFDGMDVTPVYQQDIVHSELEMARMYNRVFELAYGRPYLDAEMTFGKVHSRLMSNRTIELKRFDAPWWAEGDGFFRVLSFNGSRNLNRGALITYMSAERPPRFLGDGGLFAYRLRKSASLSGLSQDRSGGHYPLHVNLLDLQVPALPYEQEGTEGFVIPRVHNKSVKWKAKRRWISSSFVSGDTFEQLLSW